MINDQCTLTMLAKLFAFSWAWTVSHW